MYSLHNCIAYFHMARIFFQEGRDGVEAFRISGEARTFHHAILQQGPADELKSSAKFLSIMNARINPMIHTKQQHPTILVCQSANWRKRIVDGLRIKDRICMDASE